MLGKRAGFGRGGCVPGSASNVALEYLEVTVMSSWHFGHPARALLAVALALVVAGTTVASTDPESKDRPSRVTVTGSTGRDHPVVPQDGPGAGTVAGGATRISGVTGQVVAANFDGGIDGPQQSLASADLWWRWIAPQDGRFRFSTFGSEYDTVLTAFEGTVGRLTTLATNDDDGDVLTSALSIEVKAHQTVYLRATSKTLATGLATLSWAPEASGSALSSSPTTLTAAGVATVPSSDLSTSLVVKTAGLSDLSPVTTSTLASTTTPLASGTTTTVYYKDIPLTGNTGEKPQSKLWQHDGSWWAVLASVSVQPSGTWLWQLTPQGWTNVLLLSTATDVRADALSLGDVTHILLYGPSSSLVSIQYDAGTGSYALWSQRPGATSVSLPGSETATIAVDGTGRMWLASDNAPAVEVRYSDAPYTSFSTAITIATGILPDDIADVTAMPGGIGVLWSNQAAQRFGFRTHQDGAAAGSWGAMEVPAAQSALKIGGGMADDHLNMAVASDGTVYASVKTSYDTSGIPVIGLLVRRPNGVWDPFHPVDTTGTRPNVLLNEAAGEVTVMYTQTTRYDDILMKSTPIGTLDFSGSATVALAGTYNNVTTTKANWTDQVLVMASSTTATGQFFLTVQAAPVPVAPVAGAGVVSVVAGGSVQGTLPVVSSAGGVLTFEVVGSPALGSVHVDDPATGAFTYTAGSVAGADSFTFRVAEGGLWSAPATMGVTVQAAPVPVAPVAGAGVVSVVAGGSVQGTLPVVSCAGGVLTFEVVGSPALGSVHVDDPATGAFTYTAGSVAGADSFTFRVAEGGLWSAPATMGVTVQAAGGPGGVLGQWLFDEGSGKTVADSSGAGHVGTISGNPTWVSGVKGSALRLDGNGDYVTVADAPSLHLSGAMSIAVWVRPEKNATQYVAKKATSSVDGYEIGLSSGGAIFFRLNAVSSGDTYRINSTSAYPTNGSTWVHVVATYDGTTMRLFINGVQQASGKGPSAIAVNALPLVLGAEGAGSRPLTGALDVTGIYDHALTPAEVTALITP
jgi:hypothetical protein